MFKAFFDKFNFTKLSRYIQFAINHFIPRYYEANDSNSYLTHRYYQFVSVVSIIAFSGFAVHTAILGFKEISAVLGAAVVLNFVCIGIYRKTRSFNDAVNSFMALSFPIMLYTVYILEGLSSPVFYVWPVISTLCLLTLPASWALAWTGLYLSMAALFYFMPGLGPDIDAKSEIHQVLIPDFRIVTICLTQVVLFFSVYLIRRLNANLRQQLRAQAEEVKNVVRTLSHDLSSPLMTLTFSLQTLQRKSEYSHLQLENFLSTVQSCVHKISEVRQNEAKESGKIKGHFTFSDPEKDLSHVLFKFAITVLVTTFFTFGLYYVSVGVYKIGFLQISVSAAALCGWFVYKKTGSITIAGNVIMIMGATSGFFRAKMLGGIASPAFFIWPVVPIFTGILLPLVYSGFWTAVYMGLAIFFDASARVGVSFPTQISPEAANQIRILALFGVQAIVVGTVYYMKGQNKKFRDLIENQRKRRIDLLRLLTAEVGDPLKKMHDQLIPMSQDENFAKTFRSLKACLSIIEHTDKWVNSSEVEEVTAVDLREVINEVAFLQETAIRNKKIIWHVEIVSASSLPLVRGGRTSLSYQVLNNLVSNAIKFTPEGGTIRLALHATQSHWHLTVHDTGIGIPKELLNQLFDANKPTTRLGTRGEKGTGFGMPIVKMFVEKYDGLIEVNSKTIDSDPQNHGTKISILLPKATEPAQLLQSLKAA